MSDIKKVRIYSSMKEYTDNGNYEEIVCKDFSETNSGSYRLTLSRGDEYLLIPSSCVLMVSDLDEDNSDEN